MGMDPKEWGTPDPFYHFDHPRYDPQWELVQSLGVPACITCRQFPDPGARRLEPRSLRRRN